MNHFARPSIKRIAIAVAVVLAPPFFFVAGLAIWLYVGIPELFIEPVLDKMREDAHTHYDAVAADAAALSSDPLFTRSITTGVDAGPMLNHRVSWGLGTKWLPAMPSTAPERAALFAAIRDADYWDIDDHRPMPAAPEETHLNRPAPSATSIRNMAMAHLAEAAPGDVDAAKDDVEHLAVLCMTSENLPLIQLGVGLLGRLHPDQKARLKQMERFAQAMPMWLQPPLAATGFVERVPSGPFTCGAIAEGAGWALAERRLQDFEYPRQYQEVGKLLTHDPGCRLRWLRSAWQDERGSLPAGPRVFCADSPRTGFCWLPDITLLLPGMRHRVGGIYLVISVPNRLGGYAAKAPPGVSR